MNKHGYEQALKRIISLWHCSKDSPERVELDRLLALVREYELKFLAKNTKIIRAVASSTSIETGENVTIIEERLRSRDGKFKDLRLAQ